MIEVKTERTSFGRMMKCEIHGPVLELAEDTLYALRQIWTSIDRDSHGAAALFACIITDAVTGKDGFKLWCVPEGEFAIGISADGDAEASPP